jgi:glutamate synthase (NADPH/NADH)
MLVNRATGFPDKQGLYDPANEKDACGVGFIVNIEGVSSNKVLTDAKTMLERMQHRGACGCDNNTGDGAGVLTTIPHEFFSSTLMQEKNIQLPEPGKYAIAVLFIFKESQNIAEYEFERMALSYNLKVIHWRTVPVNSDAIGETARLREPVIKQAFVVEGAGLVYSNGPVQNLDFKQRVN